jgi:hypothetical protein
VGETTSTTVGGVTSTTVAGVSTSVTTPTRIEAGGGGTASSSSWQLFALLGALGAGLGALALMPRRRED